MYVWVLVENLATVWHKVGSCKVIVGQANIPIDHPVSQGVELTIDFNLVIVSLPSYFPCKLLAQPVTAKYN